MLLFTFHFAYIVESQFGTNQYYFWAIKVWKILNVDNIKVMGMDGVNFM